MELQNNELLFAVLSATVLLLLIFAFFILFFAVYRRRQLEHKMKEQRITERFKEELLRAQLELNEQLLQRVSEEIHDNIGQAVISAKMQVEVSTAKNHDSQKVIVNEILTRALADLRDLSRTLNGNFIQQEGLKAAVEREAALINNAGKIRCELAGEFPKTGMSDEVRTVVFRCIQECLSNAVKHARAGLIQISCEVSDDLIRISVTDDGKGMPEGWKSQKKGLGMHNLHNRMKLIGGNLEVRSEPGGGTCIGLTVPMEAPARTSDPEKNTTSLKAEN